MKNIWAGRERQTERESKRERGTDRETEKEREREETGDFQEEFICGNRDLSIETAICTFHLNVTFLRNYSILLFSAAIIGILNNWIRWIKLHEKYLGGQESGALEVSFRNNTSD